jgi:hypothetical protein
MGRLVLAGEHLVDARLAALCVCDGHLRGLVGVSTARRFVWPALCRPRALANATPTGQSLSPISRSICAISFPSPAKASPTYIANVANCSSGSKGSVERAFIGRHSRPRPRVLAPTLCIARA